MKKMNWRLLLIGLLVLVALGVFIGCGQLTGGSSGASYFNPLVEASAPVFKPSTASAQAAQVFDIHAQATSDWGSGNPLYAVYFSLREYINSRDNGIVDRSNIYKLLTDTDAVFSAASPDAVAITEQLITPPFTVMSAVTCDKAHNDTTNKQGIALKETSSTVNGIMTWIWSDSPTKNEYGVVNASRDATSVWVDMSYSVSYDLSTTETTYNLRGKVSGNPSSHEFEYRYIIGGYKIVGKGVSRGAGNNMLIKYAGPGSVTKYIVVPGTADEDWFEAQNTTPTAIYTDTSSLPATVADYTTWVVDTAFLTSADLLTDSNNLNSGNSRQGTIYIYYNE